MREFNDILDEVRTKIAAACQRCGRDPSEVEIVAVTKTHGAEVVREAWESGLAIVGENKVQEAAWKKAASVTGPSWHLIGHLQSNKVRQALELFDFIHSVDSVKLADRINAVADAMGASPHILLEVNVSGEGSKSGMKPEDVEQALIHIQEACPRITVEGLMTMAPFSENPEDARPHFRRLRGLRDRLEQSLGIGLPRLSMGMSGDYEVAVEEGATWVRLGTVLFGERPKAKSMRVAADDDGSSPCGDSDTYAGFGGLDSYSGAGPTVKVLQLLLAGAVGFAALAGWGGVNSFPSPTWCVRACPDGAKSAPRLWQGIAPQVREWELSKRAETLKWFEDHQFGRTPFGRLPDQTFDAKGVSFTKSGLRIDVTCVLPEGTDAAHPVPVFLFGDHCTIHNPLRHKSVYGGIPTNSIVARGYAYVTWNFNDVCPDSSRYTNSLDEWARGIIAWEANGDTERTNVVRSANSWGTIGAWAWGNSRVMDWIETRPELDATRVAVLGHSRGGKTALWTGAQDERFAMTISNGSGCGGARLGRAKDPKAETFKAILHNFPNWFCTAFTEWIGRDTEVPHDADDLIRLIAPRLVFIESASEDAWAGPAAERAAYESARDLYRAYRVPERIGYGIHLGSHKLRADDWENFMDFADAHLKAPPTVDSDLIERRVAAACVDGSRAVRLARNPRSADGAWRITRAIILPDNFTFTVDGCRIMLAPGTQDNLFRNAGAAEGKSVPNRGIRILGINGATLSGGVRNHYLPKRSGDSNGWRSVGILFCGVSDYEIGGLAFEETQCWAISQERCARGHVHDLRFGSSDCCYNQDGVDVRKGCHDLVIENIFGMAGDDAVALTAYRDPIGAPPRYGMQIGGNADCGEADDVYNVTIRNVRARSSGGHGVIRLLACDGIKMHHISVLDVVDTATGAEKRPQATIRIGDTHYHRVRPVKMGEMHDVKVENVKASGKVAIWVKGPLADSQLTGIVAAPGGRKYDITAPTERVMLDE